jgi:hypothetical protein
MSKVSQYYSIIAELMECMPTKGKFSVTERTDYSIKFNNSNCSIFLGFERYEPGVIVVLIDELENESYPIWRLYEHKGNPKMKISFAEGDDQTLRDLKYNLGFIRLFLEKELMGDFQDLKQNLAKM